MESTDYIAIQIKQALQDSRAFLNNDVQGLVECVADYQATLVVAMKKGERLKTKLDEIGSRNGDEWGKNFAQLALLQHALNESQSTWIAAMRDLFIVPIKSVIQEGHETLKFKSKLVYSALSHFDKEQEKSRNLVQKMLSRASLMRTVQPFYDEMKAKEELYSNKKLEILQELEYLRLDKAHEIAFMWAQVCDKQPRITDGDFVTAHTLPRPRPPPPSDWTSYCKNGSPLSYLLNDVPKSRKSLASSFYHSLRHIFHWHPKMDENEILRPDDSTTSSNDPSAAVSPNNSSIVTLNSSSSTLSPLRDNTPLKRLDITKIPRLMLSPIASPPQPPSLSPSDLVSSQSSSSIIDSPVYSTTPMSVSESLESFRSGVSSPSCSFELQHLSPCPFDGLFSSSNQSSNVNTTYSSSTLSLPSPSSIPPPLLPTTSSPSPSISSLSLPLPSPLSNPPATQVVERNTLQHSCDSVVTIQPDSVVTIHDESVVSDDVPSFTDDARVEEDDENTNDDNDDESVRPMWRIGGLGTRARTVMEEWIPQTEHGRVVYVKRSNTQMQLK